MTAVDKQNSSHLVGLDFIRGLSALIVVAHHLRACIFIDFVDFQTDSLLIKLFYFVTSLGHESVMVFFVLSGFFVGGSVLGKAEGFHWRAYATSRLSRLWTVLLPALVLTFVVDQALSQWAPQIISGEMQTTWRFGPGPNQFCDDLSCALGNVFFLQTIAVPCFGTNFVSWSLANEFWYYVTFPILAFVFSRHMALTFRIGYAVAGITICWWLPFEITSLGLVWLMGVIVWSMHRRNRFQTTKSSFLLMGGLLVFSSVLVWINLPGFQPRSVLMQDLATGVGFSVLAYTVLKSEGLLKQLRYFPVMSRAIAEISYSLYLSHIPVMLLLAAFVLDLKQLAPTISGFTIYFTFLFLVTVAGGVFWWLFEKRTARIRAILGRPWRSAEL